MFGLGRKAALQAEMEARHKARRDEANATAAEFVRQMGDQGGAGYDDNRGAGTHRIIGLTMNPAELIIMHLGEPDLGRPNPNGEQVWRGAFRPEEVLAVEMEIDGTTVQTSTTERPGALLRAGVGGVLFGGAGAIVGASTARTHSSGTSANGRSYGKLRIALDSSEMSVSEIDFKSNVPLCREWYARVSGFIEKGRRSAPAGSGKLERLAELAKLRDTGVIDGAEFDALKSEIIAAG